MDHLTHCRQLMELLVPLDPTHYDHTVFRMSQMTRRCCALGHAAKAGIGGLRIGTSSTPWLVTNPKLRVDEACDAVFGPNAWDRVFNVEALNLRLEIEDRGGPTDFDWHVDGEPVGEDAVYARQRGEAALRATIEALAEHMATVS